MLSGVTMFDEGKLIPEIEGSPLPPNMRARKFTRNGLRKIDSTKELNVLSTLIVGHIFTLLWCVVDHRCGGGLVVVYGDLKHTLNPGNGLPTTLLTNGSIAKAIPICCKASSNLLGTNEVTKLPGRTRNS